jgi:hypothetical protein
MPDRAYLGLRAEGDQAIRNRDLGRGVTMATDQIGASKASELLGIDRQTLSRLVERGFLSVVRFPGGPAKYSRTEIESVIKMNLRMRSL